MTEDDTFLKLARPPINEMVKLWLASDIKSWKTKRAEKFFKSHNWEIKEFKRAWIKFNGGHYI